MTEPDVEKENLQLISTALGGLINDHRTELIDEHWSEDYVEHDPLIGKGRRDLKAFIEGMLNAMPDLRWDPILAPVVSYDQVWTYGRYTGIFCNDWMDITANAKEVQFSAVDIFRVEAGEIAEHWGVMDLKTMLEQMRR